MASGVSLFSLALHPPWSHAAEPHSYYKENRRELRMPAAMRLRLTVLEIEARPARSDRCPLACCAPSLPGSTSPCIQNSRPTTRLTGTKLTEQKTPSVRRYAEWMAYHSWLRDHIGFNACLNASVVPRVLGGHIKPEVVDCASMQIVNSLTLASPLAIH